MSIILLGDSVLDNFYWLEDKKNDITKQLHDIMPDYEVKNFAVDESTINDVLYGIRPQDHYSKTRSYPYPTNDDGVVYPLELLSKESNVDRVVLSVGGNDGRVHLGKIIWGSDELLKALLDGNKFQNKLEKLIIEILKHTKNLTLVFVYKPHVSMFQKFRSQIGFGLQYFPIESVLDFEGRIDKVYESLRKIYYDMASKYNLSIIDLSKTFNPHDLSHYGSTPIEPSNKSGEVISRLIKRVVLDSSNGSSKSSIASSKKICYFSPNCGSKILSQTLY